ncbi:unnamed protein product [Diabrotica balteata]|uniref:Uncharacterized protein n=1 Tax=Diabrotica balteata TaxID=107213 RepID=A0A9N9XAC0_DIABA|nr:unnamed protein product [Diabrotica balteata]
MEIKQEASEKTCKVETYDSPLNALKIEIKEEPKTETASDAFDYLKEFPVNNEVKQDEYKFTLFEEKQATTKESK